LLCFFLLGLNSQQTLLHFCFYGTFGQGQVPPYAQPQITQFAIQEGIIKTVEAMVSAYGLQSLSGSDGQVQVHEDVQAMAKVYSTGTSIQFTATLKATYDEAKIQQQLAINAVDLLETSVDVTDVATMIVTDANIEVAANVPVVAIATDGNRTTEDIVPSSIAEDLNER
jgi:hypothetical protein